MRFVRKDVFYGVVHFVLLYSPRPGCGMEDAPSPWWDGGRCRLRELSRFERGDEQFEEFQAGVGRPDGWMVVGRNRMRIVCVSFENVT